MVLARIQEQPAALRVAASAHPIDGFRRHQIRRAHGERPKGKRGIVLRVGPFPIQTRRLFPIQFLPDTRRLEISLQRLPSSSRGVAPIQSGVEDLSQRLAKLLATLNRPRARSIAGRALQSARLRWSQQFRLLGEPQQIAVTLEQFFRTILPESPVQSIDKIERRVTRHQKETQCSLLGNPLTYLDRLPTQL